MVAAAGILKTVNPNPVVEGSFCIGEWNVMRSNEQAVLAITAVELPAGTVLGKITATGIYTPLNPGASDGSQNFAGILWERRPISAATQKCAVLVRSQVVNARLLNYQVAVSGPQKTAAEVQMAAAGVIPRY